MKSAGVDQCLPFNFICLSRFAEQNKKGELFAHSGAASQLAVGFMI